jgi:hypothetical protein
LYNQQSNDLLSNIFGIWRQRLKPQKQDWAFEKISSLPNLVAGESQVIACFYSLHISLFIQFYIYTGGGVEVRKSYNKKMIISRILI